MDLEAWSTRLKVFADATRVRLLALLAREELTVAELSAITQLAQPRVSTHLAKLKEAGLARDRRAGVSAYYRFDEDNLDSVQRELWRSLRDGSDDPLLRQDAERITAVLANRAADQNWADSVAGDMERHYSPGRTWEALARTALPLLETGDVLDIASGDGVLAELLSPHAKRYICIDTSARVVAAAGVSGFRFNSAIAKLYAFVATIRDNAQAGGDAKRQALSALARLIAPFTPHLAEEIWASVVADGRDEVLTAVRENLRLGASQIKIAAGGGTSSEYDPLDVTQYTLDEMKAAVDAAMLSLLVSSFARCMTRPTDMSTYWSRFTMTGANVQSRRAPVSSIIRRE